MTEVVLLQCREKLRFSKIRPKRWRDYQLRIRNLPKQEVADAHFAAGPDQQIGVRQVMGIEVLRKNLLVDVGGIEFARFHLLRQAANGVDNLGAPAITERHNKR